MPRSNCIYKNGYFIKDLRIIKNRDLNNIIIVDNSIISFANHLDQGIPIPSFFGNKDDNMLLFLLNFLKELSAENDIKASLIKHIGLSKLYNSYKKSKEK